jgi:SWI/SNF-related matrix-associated actin-dependent regulator 1 of chromatin subfamily A
MAVQGKLKQSIEWIENFLYGNGKLVVFAVHKFVIEELMKAFPDVAVKIDGSTSMTDRDKAVTEFQTNDKIRLFVGNIQAAGVGLTLTAASNVAFLEYGWTPGQIFQAADRVHRIGQKECVTIHYLLAANTIEEKIMNLIGKKQQILNSVLDGEPIDKNSIFQELLDSYLK